VATEKRNQTPPLVPGFEVWLYQATRPGGLGDLLVCVPLDDSTSEGARSWLIALGEVNGRDVTAARLREHLESKLVRLAEDDLDPAAVLYALHRSFPGPKFVDLFACVLAVTVDARRAEIRLANAGHVAPLIVRADGSLRTVEAGAAFPLWVVDEATYATAFVDVAVGEVVVLVSDGAIEERLDPGDVFGVGRLRAALAGVPPRASAVGPAILAAGNNRRGRQPPGHDVTILCLGRTAVVDGVD
jgi:serine phosphatase RsbU (regulator of sigma subunit)